VRAVEGKAGTTIRDVPDLPETQKHSYS